MLQMSVGKIQMLDGLVSTHPIGLFCFAISDGEKKFCKIDTRTSDEPDTVPQEHGGEGDVEAPAWLAVPPARRHRQAPTAGLLRHHQEADGSRNDQETTGQ